ncbi:MAG: hypothetical protein ACXWYS_06060 [Gaiellaceae bacterium]
MSKRIALVVSLLALSAGSASAGGFATAGVAPPPGDIDAGQTWNASIEIKQHGRTPLAGLSPTLTIRKGDVAKTFPAEPTDVVGVYVAHVKFPAAGEWQYEVMDGFAGVTHTFAPVTVASAPAADEGVSRWWFVLAVGVLAALGIAALLAGQRAARPARAAT